MRRLLAVLVFGSLISFAQGGGVAWADPAGNNGTVKIQEHGDIDSIPDNDPHVGCVFQIEFRGFDEGDLHATWTLSAQPPSGDFTQIATDVVFIGEDPAGGAPDLDAVVVVDLADFDLTGLMEHPQQGFHLKLEVHAEGSIGNDTKFKVFWVEGCPPYPPVPSTEGETVFGNPSSVASDAPAGVPFALLAAVVVGLAAALVQPIRGLARRRSGD